MPVRTTAGAAVFLGLVVFAPRADASDAIGCGAFSLTGGDKVIEVIDEFAGRQERRRREGRVAKARRRPR